MPIRSEERWKIQNHELAKYDRRTWPALRVACPTCKVPPGSPCFRKSNDGVKIPLLQPHAKRVYYRAAVNANLQIARSLIPMLFWILLALVFAIVALAFLSDYIWAKRG